MIYTLCRVLLTSQLDYYASKPIENAVYCIYELKLKTKKPIVALFFGFIPVQQTIAGNLALTTELNT